jgi:dolichol-phosphate mannosyltransferase
MEARSAFDQLGHAPQPNAQIRRTPRLTDVPSSKPAIDDAGAIVLTVIVPVKNEADNILPLIREIRAALAGGPAYEIVYIDDGSTDATRERLAEASRFAPELRILYHAASCGQSAALRTGVLGAKGRVIATLDGDGQNDPADLPRLVAAFLNPASNVELGMIAGQRLKRRDSTVKRWSSRIANKVRSSMLGDDTPDTGCGLKVFARDAFLRLPYFDHIHRFLPALMRREGFVIGLEPVNHRPRTQGVSKYGINNRLWVGIVDLFGVFWLQRRMRRPTLITPADIGARP